MTADRRPRRGRDVKRLWRRHRKAGTDGMSLRQFARWLLATPDVANDDQRAIVASWLAVRP